MPMLNSLVNLFFPKVCYACQNGLTDYEDTICVDCRHNLPITNFHFEQDSTVEKVLYGRAQIESGTALFRFEKKGKVQQLIHNLKYRGHENIGFVLGNWLGSELKTVPAYQNIDMVIPVPLHKKKLKKRGYNQVSTFGVQLAKALNAEYAEGLLIKITDTKSQVNKKRFARWNSNTELFSLTNIPSIENKHVLIVDDLITTGATLEACIAVLNDAKNVKISIATMAIAL